MKKQVWWRGVEGVTVIDHGEWSDPELKYGNIVSQHFGVEEDLSNWFEEETGVKDTWDGNHEEQFDQWCQENREQVIELIAQYQQGDNKYELTFRMWDEILEEFSQDEYNYMLASLKYKKCKLNDMEDFGARMEKIIDEYTERNELAYGWWKYDYSTICTATRSFLHGANIDSVEALVLAMEDGFI